VFAHMPLANHGVNMGGVLRGYDYWEVCVLESNSNNLFIHGAITDANLVWSPIEKETFIVLLWYD
jgi:hypothetical protein